MFCERLRSTYFVRISCLIKWTKSRNFINDFSLKCLFILLVLQPSSRHYVWFYLLYKGVVYPVPTVSTLNIFFLVCKHYNIFCNFSTINVCFAQSWWCWLIYSNSAWRPILSKDSLLSTYRLHYQTSNRTIK